MSKRRDKRPNGLSDEDKALWDTVARSITPLEAPQRRKAAQSPAEPPPPAARPGKAKRPPRPRAAPASTAIQPPKRPSQPPASQQNGHFDQKLMRKLSRRRTTPDSVLDLHGLRQTDAHRRLLAFLRAAQARGDRLVAVITGKGRGPAGSAAGWDEDRRGVLRQAVPQWLRLPEFRPYVVGHRVSPRLQGGEGAIYVQVRRKEGRR